ERRLWGRGPTTDALDARASFYADLVRALSGILALGTVMCGCGPSLSSLVKDKRYGEAMCAAATGSAADRATVSAMLLDDLDLALDVRVVDAARLEEVVGAAAEDIAARFTLLEVRTMRRRLPLSGQRIELTSRAGQPLGAKSLA